MGLNMAHAGQLPPLWPFLENPTKETLHIINLEAFTEKVNDGCAPDALV